MANLPSGDTPEGAAGIQKTHLAKDSGSTDDDAPDDASSIANAVAPVQKLYRRDCEYRSCPTRWPKFAVHEEERDALEAEVRESPIVQRHFCGRNQRWNTHSFTVNRPHMRAFLLEALDKYPDLDLDLARRIRRKQVGNVVRLHRSLS